MNYISIHLYRKMINHARLEGIDESELENLSTPLNMIDKIQAVPADHFFELHEKFDERLGSGFSVRIGQAMKIEDYGVLGLSWRTCSRAGEIFDRCERYFKLLSNTYVFKVENENDISHIYLNRDAYRRGVELSNEATFSAAVVVLQAMTEKNILPININFKHDPPGSFEDYSQAFQCPVLFKQPYNVISYTTDDLNTRTAKADLLLNKFLVERVEEETNGIEIKGSKLCMDVEDIIKDALPSGIPALLEVAEQIGMSARTLTRRLAENDVTFRDLIKKSQEDISKNLLTTTKRNIAEIAFETGFSEQSAFNRAFKRWTGLSPLEYRKQE